MSKAGSVRQVCQALVNLLVIRHLIMEAIRLFRELPGKKKDADPVYSLLLELEPHYYLGLASILMHKNFGAPGTEAGELAYKALKGLLVEQEEA